jgi:hypothetical protein
MAGHAAVKSAHAYGVQCFDWQTGQQPASDIKNWIWQIGLAPLRYAGRDESGIFVRLDVTRIRVQNGGLLGARQLALFRALFVQGVTSIDRRANVTGGQRTWTEEWWAGDKL